MNNENLKNKKMELRLAKKVLFKGMEIECYEDATREDGDFYMTRNQISESLEYDDSNSFHKVIQRKRDKIGEPIIIDKLSTVINKSYETELYSFEQLFEIIDGSRQPKAELFRKWAVRTLKELVTGRAELKFKRTEDMFNYKKDINEMVENLKQMIIEEVSKPLNDKIESIQNENKIINTENKELHNKMGKLIEISDLLQKKMSVPMNSSTMFEVLREQFNDFTSYKGRSVYYEFYNNLEDWFGVKIPSDVRESKFKNPKRWFLGTIGIEKIEQFVNGVRLKRIVKSNKGHWVDMYGIYENDVEFEKIKKYFDYKCAYCGEEKELVGEHLIPQSDPSSSDTLYNLVCSCFDCNKKKFAMPLKQWVEVAKLKENGKLDKIKAHYTKYYIKPTNSN